MKQLTYMMTVTAEQHFLNVLRDTARKWGKNQAEKYRILFLNGLQYIANNYHLFRSLHKEQLAEGTDFSLCLNEHHYVAFQAYSSNYIIVAGIFHESMDIPSRLKELQSMSGHDIDLCRKKIDDIEIFIDDDL